MGLFLFGMYKFEEFNILNNEIDEEVLGNRKAEK